MGGNAWRRGWVTAGFSQRPVGMETDDPMARVRERRFRALLDALLPKVRRLNPNLPDEQVLELAEAIAERQLRGEDNR
jgi:hypothetical protein